MRRPAQLTRRELLTTTAALATLSALPRIAWAADSISAERLVYGGSWEGLAGVAGGIPNYIRQSGATIDAYSGSAAAINSAIASAPDDTFVQLGAGTFNLSSGIAISTHRVVLRGSTDSEGRPLTVLNFTTTAQSAHIWMGAAGWDLSDSGQFSTLNVTSGAMRGSASLALVSAPTSLVVGQCMFISAATGITPGSGNWSDLFRSRPFTQIVRIMGKTGNEVIFSPAINADYLTGTVQVHWRPAAYTLKLSGIENLSLTRAAGVGGHYVRMDGADECWMRNIKSYGVPGGTYHVFPYGAYRCEIRRCDISHMDSLTSSTYCINPAQSSQLLIEDNYFHDCPNVMPMFGLNGSAFAYNYINDLPYTGDWLSQIVFFHGSHNHYNLFEGNWCATTYNDSGAGSRNNIWLRNRLRGWDAAGPKASNCQAVTVCPNHANLVLAGNVLGENSFHTRLLATFSGASNSSNSIYNFSTSASVELLGNYNTVDDAVPPAEALPAGAALPASYLHSTKPAWFGVLPWPPIEPANFAQSNNPQNIPAGYRAIKGQDPDQPPAPPENFRSDA